MRHEDIKVEQFFKYATRLKVGVVIRRLGCGPNPGMT
jgi:hypothetical protein